MDPRLAELLQEGEDEDEVAVLVRLADPHAPPRALEVVSVFGDVATARVRRGSIPSVRAEESVLSVKAAQTFAPEPDAAVVEAETELLRAPEDSELPRASGDSEGAPEQWHDERRPADEPATGRGVVIGFIDWGCDFAHPDLRHADGSTRLLALWDQRADAGAGSPRPWGYGIVHSAEEINRALATHDPYGALRYNPADADPRGDGSHATHCMGIAAGNGRAGTPLGVAPEADLVFVHMTSSRGGSSENLADSVTLIEAVDFIVRASVDRPLVISLSMGATAGEHDGKTLVEHALDAAVTSRSGLAIAQSTGNYFARPVHTVGRLRPGMSSTIRWLIDAEDPLTSEIEVWYPGVDVFGLEIRAPGGQGIWNVPLATQATLAVDGDQRGRAYHRSHEPNNGQNHIQVFLYPHSPDGTWELELTGVDVSDGRFHCWVERAGSGPHDQSLLDAAQAVHTTTTNAICNGYRTIVVGAYDAHSPGCEPAPFSSSGPTVDDRVKPDLLAPGVQVLSARSASGQAPDQPRAVRKSGTSMAAPHVAGTIALMFEAAGRLLPIAEVRSELLRSCQPLTGADWATRLRAGDGYLNTATAVAAARRSRQTPAREAPAAAREAPSPAAREAGDEPEASDDQAWVSPAAAEAVRPVGQVVIDGSSQAVKIEDSAPAYSDTGLDGALQFALSRSAEHSVILGDPLGGARFDVYRWGPSGSLSVGRTIEFDAAPEVCVLVCNGGDAVFLRSLAGSSTHWFRLARAREFYRLPAVDRTAQRASWLARLRVAPTGLTAQALSTLSMPAMRLLLIRHAARAMPVTTVRRGEPPADRGGEVDGVTLPILSSPVVEPDCYLPVIARVEGRLESINAWDQGAGISIGPIQINVQREALFRFLRALFDGDRPLFDAEFGTPLGWSVTGDGDHDDLSVSSTGMLHAVHADERRNVRFFQSGTADGPGFDGAFRRGTAAHMRNVLVYPHVQDIVGEVSSSWLRAGLTEIESSGIAAIDGQNPDHDAFVLKALLLSAYVRFSGCLSPLLARLDAWQAASDKLANFTAALAHLSATCRTLEPRMARQTQHAEQVYRQMRRLLDPTVPELESDERAPVDRDGALDGQALADLRGLTGEPLTPAVIVDALTAGHHPALAGRLRQAIVVVAAPGQPADGRLASGDILLSRAIGEPGNGFTAVIADPALSRRREFGSAVGLFVATRDPACNGDGRPPLRRLADEDGMLLDGHVVVRRREPGEVQDDREAQDEERAAEDVVTLSSPRFTADPDLQAVAAGRLRLGAPGTAPYPAPVRSQGDGVRAVQQALLDLGSRLPGFGADGRFGAETGAAVASYKTDKGIYPNDGVVGPHTIAALDADIVVHDAPPHPAPSPPPPPSPLTRDLVDLERRYFPNPPAKDAAPHTRLGDAQPIIDGTDYFAALLGEIRTLRSGDLWYWSGWLTHANHPLDSLTGTATLSRLALDAVERGVDVRGLIWTNKVLIDHRGDIRDPGLLAPLLSGMGLGPEQRSLLQAYIQLCEENIRNAEALRGLTDRTGGRPLAQRILLDWSGDRASSHHMKAHVFAHGDRLTAYCGGIDLVENRWDWRDHPPLGGLVSDTDARGNPRVRPAVPGWHDLAVKVTGEAAAQVLRALQTRWFEASTLSDGDQDVTRSARPYNPRPRLPNRHITYAQPPASLSTSIQIVRSVPAVKEYNLILPNRHWDSLPVDGVHEMKLTLTQALAAAQQYIYIEDQSFDATATLFPLLRAALGRGVKVIALTVGSNDPGDPGAKVLANCQLFSNSLALLSGLPPAAQDNFALWRLAWVVIHSKLVIIDDEYYSIGSANFMDRSMQPTPTGDDSEITACVVSTGSAVTDLRADLWCLHLGITDPAQRLEVADLDRSLGFWRPGKGWGRGFSFPLTPDPACAATTTLNPCKAQFVGPSAFIPVPPSPQPSAPSLLGPGGLGAQS